MIRAGADPGPRRLLAFETVTVAGAPLVAVFVVMSVVSLVLQTELHEVARGLAHAVVGLLLMGYALRRRGESLAAVGLRGGLRAILLSIIAALPLTFLAYAAIGAALVHLPLGVGAAALEHGRPAMALDPWALTLAYILVGPIFEETVVRAYLMTRLATLGVPTIGAIVLSVALQTAYHAWEGWTFAFVYAPAFLLYALYFAWRRNALAPVLSHSLLELTPWAAQMGIFGRRAMVW